MRTEESTKFSIKARLRSISFALEGFISLIKYEHNSRIYLTIEILAIILGILLHINITEWILIVLVSGLVWTAEFINTTIEKIADLTNPEINPKVKLIKDYAAASVLVSAVVALIVGGLIFVPRLMILLK